MPPRIRPDMSTGERIAVWRVYRGMTQETCAGLVGKSVSWWKKIESGVRRVEKLSDLLLIARILRVGDLTDLTGVLEFPLSLDRGGDPELVPAVRQAMREAIRSTVSAAEPPSPRTLPERVDEARDLFHRDRRFVTGLGRLLPALILDATAAHRRNDGADRRRSALLLSEVYLLACQWLRHVSAYDLALLAVDRSATFAHEAGDPVSIALAGWQMAGALKDTGSPEAAYDVALDAVEGLTPHLVGGADRTLAVWGHLKLQAALMAAHCSDEGTALRHWDQGVEAAGAFDPDYVEPMTVFSAGHPECFRVWIETALGHGRRAVDAANRIDIDAVPSAPVRSLLLLSVARGYAARRDDVATLHVLRRAEHESAETVAQSGHVREMCREMMRRDRKIISRDLHDFARRIGIFA